MLTCCLRKYIVLFMCMCPAVICQNVPGGRVPFVSGLSGTDTLFFTGALGSISVSPTPNAGRTHALGSIRLTNADYTRAGFDGVPEELKTFVVSTMISVTYQIVKTGGFFHQMPLTIGTQQGLTNRKIGVKSGFKAWYESNYFAGLALVMPHRFVAAVSYLLAVSPNVNTFGNELDLSFAYLESSKIGNWRPSLEISFPLGSTEGFLVQFIANPSLDFFQKSKAPFGLVFPLRLGAGMFDYYAPHTGFAGYIGGGVVGQLALKAIPQTFGNWNITLGVELVWRNEIIASADLPEDTGGNVLLFGNLGLNFLF